MKTKKDEAIMHLLGFMFGIQMMKNGYKANTKATYNTNGYVAQIAVGPMVLYTTLYTLFRFLCIPFAVFAITCLVATIKKDGVEVGDDIAAGLSLCLLLSLIATFASKALLKRHKADPGTVNLAKDFGKVLKWIPVELLEKFRDAVFVDEASDDVIAEIKGFEQGRHANMILVVLMNALCECALEIKKLEGEGKVARCNDLIRKLENLLSLAAAIGLCKPDGMKGKLFGWADKKLANKDIPYLAATQFEMPIPKAVVAS